MALDKLVDSTQLNADLTSVADSIRAKGGTSAELQFPGGFVDAVEAIETGGQNQLIELMNGNAVDVDDDSLTGTITLSSAKLRSIRAKNATAVGYYLCRLNPGLVTFFGPNAWLNTECFKGCYTLVTCVAKGPYDGLAGTRPLQMYQANKMALTSVDFTAADYSTQPGTTKGIGALCFEGDYKFNLLILRSVTLWPLKNINAFNSTPFESGGSGGTIYIPKTLYDHLGDGSALDYKAATNWSTIDGYGTITWAQIEGSQYETAYADGTPIT